MHPNAHSPDASSDPGRGEEHARDAIRHDSVVEEFNAFFEKLSSLDSLQWTPESETEAPPAPQPEPPAAAPRRKTAERSRASAAGAAGAGAAAGAAAKPKMTVVKSDTDLADEPPSLVAEVERAARGRITARDVARFLKMTMVGLLLFALGLGAGWAALSLPGHMEEVMPNVSRLMERTRTLAGGQAAGERASAVRTPAAQAERTAPRDRLHVVEADRRAPAGSTESRDAGSDASASARSQASSAPEHTAATPEAPREGAASTASRSESAASAPTIPPPGIGALDRDIELPSAAGHPDEPVAVSDADGESAAMPAARTGEARFTLQVGACSSYDCVENYRRMLLRNVSSAMIKVVSQSRGEGTAPIHRIRVQPLDRAAAERLKSDLSAEDPRFRDAYLIDLR